MRKQGIGVLLAIVTIMPKLAFAQASPSPFTYAYRYDAMHRVVGTLAPESGGSHLAVRNTYDNAGNVIKVEQGSLSWPGNAAPANWGSSWVLKVTDITYDTSGRKLTEKLSSGGGVAYALTQYSYDAAGRLECTAVRMNPAAYGSPPSSACSLGTEGSNGPDRITRNEYDLASQLIKIQRAVNTGIQQDYAAYTYTPNGKQETIKDARGYKAQMDYDGFDRLAYWGFPDRDFTDTVSGDDYEAYGYDANSNRTSLRKRDGRYIHYGYDALNRVTSKTYPNGGGGADPVNYTYNLLGNTTGIKFTNGQGMTRVYDGFGQLKSDQVSLPGISKTLSYLYDVHGNRTRMTFNDDGNYVTYHYDGLDRPDYLYRGSSTVVASYTYDAAGRRATFGGGFTTSYGYDGVGRLTSQTVTPANSSYQVQYGFGYNPASQIIRESRDNVAYAWTGLATATDGYGTANGLNQYPTVKGGSMSYDDNGNLTYDGSPGTTVGYGYDIENRLVSASNGTTLAYDPLGRLYQVSGSNGTTRFVYDGDALIQELDSGGTTLRRYIHGVDAGDDPIAWYEGAGFSDSNERLMRSNHQGSITVVADRTTATIHGVNRYDEYGNPQPSGNLGRFQYTGQAWIPELGLYHYKARAYSPKLGRFLQTDPVGYEDDINLYAYVKGDPVNNADPSGTTCTGSKIENDDGTCKSTGGNTTDSAGVNEGMASKQSAKAMMNFMTNGLAGNYGDAVKDALEVVASSWRESFETPQDAILTIMSMVPVAGLEAKTATVMASDGAVIKGFTGHGVNRAIGDGLKRAGTKPAAILDAVRNPTKVLSGVDELGRPYRIYYGKDARVIINPDTGRVVQTNPLSAAGVR